MNLKTVVDSIIEALREKGLDDNTIETILSTWKSKEGLEDLNTNYDRNKIKSLFQVIEAFYSEAPKEMEEIPSEVQEEVVEEEAVEVDEESIEKELEELVRLLSSSEEDMEELPVVESDESEELLDEETEEELEKELQEFAEFLEKTSEGGFIVEPEEEEGAEEAQAEQVEQAKEELIEESTPETESEETPQPPIKIVEQEEETKLRTLVEELVESTPEPIKLSDIQIRGLRLAAVVGDRKVEKILVFKEGEEKPQIAKLYEAMSSIWKLTGYEVHGFDSFHVKSGALILYGEKIEGKTYIAVVESETVGGAKFIILALKKLLSQE